MFHLGIPLSIVGYSAVRLKAKKSTALIATVSIAILVLAFAQANILQLTEKFWFWKTLVLVLAVLIVLEICLRVVSRDTSRRKSIDFDYIESLGQDFLTEYNAYYASLRVGTDFNSYCLENKITLHQININNESRLTVDQPSEPYARIFILGGSTVFNAQVPNSHTIASLLQSKLRKGGSSHSVINFGKSGATSVDRIEFIKNQNVLHNGDTVVLYFGINDACITKRAFEYKSNPIHLVLVAFNMVQSLFSKYLLTFEKLPRISKFRTKYAVKKYINEEVIVAIQGLDFYCKNLGVKFLAVLQPSAYSYKGLNRTERHYLNQFANSPKRALQVANRLILKKLCGERYFVDGSRIFDYAEGAVFTDWCHTTRYGNLLLSGFFLTELEKRNFLRS